MSMEYNCVIIGTKGVGKSTFINRLKTGDFTPNLSGGGVTQLTFNTPKGIVTFNVYDGVECSNPQCRIVMASITDGDSLLNAVEQYKNLPANIPHQLLVVNKAELRAHPTWSKMSVAALNHVNVSTLMYTNLDLPFRRLLEVLVGKYVPFIKMPGAKRHVASFIKMPDVVPAAVDDESEDA